MALFCRMEKNDSLHPDHVLAAAVDTITEKTFNFDITIVPKGKVHALLQRFRLARKKVSFELRPVSVGTLYRISKMILSLEIDNGAELNQLTRSYLRVKENAECIIDICAAAIHNQKSEAPDSLKALIRDNLTSQELMKLMALVVNTLAIENFIVSIVLVKGMNVLANPPASAESAE
ncbi:MAG: hypothetical protein ACK40M_04355 [Flavobacteriales bacterium]